MSYEAANFEDDVIARSRALPVLVDFWAGWCGPCRTLGPVLERLEQEADGAWVLAKVDVDQNQEVAARYRVQGIPAVKLFVDGEVAGEFTGALPERQVAQWLEAHLPSEERDRLESAIALAEAGRSSEAKSSLSELVSGGSGGDPARALLAQLTVFDSPAAAAELVEGIGAASDAYEAAAATREIAAALLAGPGSFPEGPARARFLEALEALREQDVERALEGFLDTLIRDRGYDKGRARRLCVALFAFLGAEHSLTVKFRRRLQSALN